MDCTGVMFSGHALRRMFERRIDRLSVSAVIRSGETILDYPDDRPYPSRLLLGWVDGGPLHVVVARDPGNGMCYVITVYIPDAVLWSDDFRTRR